MEWSRKRKAFTDDRQAADNGVSACNCIFMGKGEDKGAKRNVQAIAHNAPLGGTNQEFHQESREISASSAPLQSYSLARHC